MLKNKAPFSELELAVIFGENNLHNINEDFNASGVVIDTRILEPGNIFAALKGENIDGHDLIEQAFISGASACIIEKVYFEEIIGKFPDKSFIVTNDNIEALGKLANHHRRRFEYPVMGVGGANGKTTTKEMIATVLSEEFRVLKTYGNYNNKIGVPLMLLQMSDEYDIAILEIGTNTPGEIYDLSNIVEPTHALITNIGKEHLEFLIDLDGVELEETYLFAKVRSDGFAFVNYDDVRLKLYGHVLGRFITYGIDEHAQFRCEYTLNDELNPIVTVMKPEGNFIVNMQTVGYASALNAIAAIAVGDYFGVESDKIIKSLENFEPLEGSSGYGRMALSEINGIRIINDTYNANPDSMSAALKNLEMIKIKGRKYAVLGDMRELGIAAPQEHYNIIEIGLSVSDKVLVTGYEMIAASKRFNSDKLMTFSSNEIIAEYLKNNLLPGDCVLVKGSRGMKMEEVIINLKQIL